MRVRGYPPATPCLAELVSGDPAASAAFYTGLFGWQTITTDSGSTVFTLRNLVVAGLAPAVTKQQPSAWLTYISTEDTTAAVEAVTGAGGTVLLPPTDVGSRGRMAMCADPEGAVFGLWQRTTFSGAQVVTEPNAVCWNELMSRDTEQAATFYGKTFGWVEKPGGLAVGVDYLEWHVDHRVVAGMTPMDSRFPPAIPAHWRTILEVDDCAAIISRCVELGGTVVAGPMDVVVGQYAQLIDPLGASVGVVELISELRLSP